MYLMSYSTSYCHFKLSIYGMHNVRMCVCVRMYVYMCVCVYVCMCVCVCVCTYVCMYACMYVWMYGCMHVLTDVWGLPLTTDTYMVKIWFRLPLPFSICQTL